MKIEVSEYERLGAFYLGRGYDAEARELTDELQMYDSRDLVTHGVVLGMTGSGKTGLCMALLEEAAMDHIPAIIIDPKGDIANLLLTFPGMTAAEFLPWVNEEDAVRKGVSVEEHAAKTASMWKEGLEEWGQTVERVKTLRERVDVNLFTPGSKAGIPVSILSSLAVPPFEIMDDAELLAERIESTVQSLLAMIGLADAVLQREGILLSLIFQKCWAVEQDVSLESLVRSIQKPTFDRVGVIDLESYYPSKDRQELAMKLNHLIASPGFAQWLEGVPLDIGKMLAAPDGRARMSIFSIAHLGDEERMFFVSLLLNQVLGWMRTQSGTTSLRALLYMDEIFGYLPPTANPPSKKPMMTLLKQSRAFGLGCLLATQNPADLDYKALSNIGTWFLGRLQTERDKMRVLDGLEGAAGAQNTAFDRAKTEKLLSGLENRVFLMNNVHDGAPSLFHVRWVMSYLRGPLTRSQIKVLMDPKRAVFISKDTASTAVVSDPMAMPGMNRNVAAMTQRPAVGVGVVEKFVTLHASGENGEYRPHLLRQGKVYFQSPKMGVEGAKELFLVNPILADSIGWDEAVTVQGLASTLSSEPEDGVSFTELPGYAMNQQSYAGAAKEFAEWMYRQVRLEVLHFEELDLYPRFGEEEGDFRARLALRMREKRDADVAKLREESMKKLQALETRLQAAEAQLAKQKSEANSAKMQAGVSILTGVLGAFLGGGKKANLLGKIAKGKMAIQSASSALKQGQDVTVAESKVSAIHGELAAFQEEMEFQIQLLTSPVDPAAVTLATAVLKPTKADVKVENVCLLWVAS